MNRREFTASLAALAATPALPMVISAAAAPQSATVPAGTYAWAQLIARAQNRCSPAMLARHLRLPTDAATALFNEMVRDGVLRAPGIAGVAQAAQPINATGTRAKPLRKLRDLIRPDTQSDKAPPLVKDADLPLECDETALKEDHDARETQSVQSRPQER